MFKFRRFCKLSVITAMCIVKTEMKKNMLTRNFAIILFCIPFSLAIVAFPLESRAQQQDCRGAACVEFGGAIDDQKPVLPLEKATQTKVNKRRDKEKKAGEKHPGKVHPQCVKELNKLPELRDEDRIQKFCNKSPGHQKVLLQNDPIFKDGKKRGKKVKTKTTLKFDKPSQRYGHDKREKWDNLIVRKPTTGDMKAGNWRGQSNTKDRGRNQQFLDVTSQGENNDRDCADSFTGEHKGGASIPDGAGNSCFDKHGILKQTLTITVGGCVHDNGTFFPGDRQDGLEDDCFDAEGNIKNTLVELIDEDGLSPDNDNDGIYDIDGDGFDGEDPPAQDGYPGNDDRDCVDTITGQHLRDNGCFEGFDLRQTLTVAWFGCKDSTREYVEGDPYDGVEDDCYESGGTPKPAMTPIAQGCLHRETGTFFEGDPGDGIMDACYDASGKLRTTLAELIDEDDGMAIDDDGDGYFDEDPRETPMDFEQACYAKAISISGNPNFDMTGVYTQDGGCDLTRPMIVNVNKRAMAQPEGKKAYKADDQGYYEDCNDDVCKDAVEYGFEPRTLVIEEEFTVLCGENEVLDEPTGQCIPEDQEVALADYRASMQHSLTARDISLNKFAMMGFTFAPPRVRWGLFYKEEIDLFFFTFTLFEAKIGYDFALGVGFRLPVQVTASNLPEGSILAESDLDLVSRVSPENFSAQEYRTFCTERGMGNSAYCNRFAFPNAINPADGDELAIRLTAFAGIKVVVLEIPLINWGVDIDMDMPEMCSLYLAYENIEDVAQEMVDNGVSFSGALSTLNMNCGTYTTPYGNDKDGNPLQFPFIQNAPVVNQMVRADCAEAFARGETVKLPDGEVYPLCTGIILGVHGASLGLGLGVDLEMNSNLIEANASVSGDATFRGHSPGHVQALQFIAADNGGSEEVVIETIRVDNYDDSDDEDYARVALDDFTYCLNNFSIRLKGQAMFGGILTIFPDFPDFTIYRLTMPIDNTTCFIPIGQHARTGVVEFPVLVENYGLEVNVNTDPADPNRVDDKTIRYPYDSENPGGHFLVSVKNIGSFPDGFDNFSYDLSNLRDQAKPYTFLIDPDNDDDGLVDEDDFGPAGALRDVRDEDSDGMADEDPPDNWQSVPPLIEFNVQIIDPVPEHMESDDAGIDSLTLKITPFIHPSTSPGIYPFRVTADSMEAKGFGLSALDPSLNHRIGAADIAFIKVESFYDPRVAVVAQDYFPAAPSAKPGISIVYTVEGTNMGNSEDRMSVSVEFKDFNEAGCTLTTRGTLPGCPYRAEPTMIQDGWTTIASLATRFPLDPFDSLAPLGSATDVLSITAPGDWEGMVDTTYLYEVTTTSLEDDDPPASNLVVVEHIVLATKESMVRYIRHEILDLITEIETANAQGIKTGGLLPIAMHPIQAKIDQALELILSGKTAKASNALESSVKVMEAFVHALDGYNGKGNKIPADQDADWHARAAAIIADLQVAAN